MKKIAKNIFLKGLNLFEKVQNSIEIDNTLTIDGYDEKDDDFVLINSRTKKLYAVAFAGATTIEDFIDDLSIDKIFEAYKLSSDAKIIQVFYKQGYVQKNVLLSSNKDILTIFQKKLDGVFLNFLEITDFLYNIFLNNQYSIENKTIKQKIDIVSNLQYELLSRSFSISVKDAIAKNLSNLTLYQSYKIRNRIEPIKLSNLFKLPWEGVIFNTFEIEKNSVEALIKTRRQQALMDGKNKPFTKLLNGYETNAFDLAIFNSLIMLKNGDLNTALEIGSYLGVDYLEKSIDTKKYIKYTPLVIRDNYYDLLVDKKFLYGFFGITHKMEVKNPDIYGLDGNGSFFSIRWDQTTKKHANKSSDAIFIGVKGSGKTTTVNSIFAQMLGISLDEEKSKKIGNFNEKYANQKIRYFDIKKSGLLLANMVHERSPDTVKFISTSISNFSFNPINIKKVKNYDGDLVWDQDELTMNILLLSIVLESKNRDNAAGLTASEQALLKEVILNIYNEKLYKCDYILSLKEINPTVYNELIALGYSDTDNLEDVKEDKFNFLKVPTLNVVIKNVRSETQNTENTNTTAIATSLLSKLELIDKIGIFSGYDKFNFEDTQFIHIDFDPIKDLDEYTPIFLSLFLKQYRIDKTMQENATDKGNRPFITYVFEEAKNVTERPSFADFLKKVINEARSYRIKLFFVTQLIEHIPSAILQQINNQIFLLPAKNQRNMLIESINEKKKLSESSIKALKNAEEFYAILINEHGTMVFKQDNSREEIEYFGQAQ